MSRIRQFIALVTLIAQYVPLSQVLAVIRAVGSFPSTPDQVRPWLVALGLSDPILSLVATALEKLLAPKPAALAMSASDLHAELDEAIADVPHDVLAAEHRDAAKELGRMYAAAVGT